jgi:hypothetical protein
MRRRIARWAFRKGWVGYTRWYSSLDVAEDMAAYVRSAIGAMIENQKG